MITAHKARVLTTKARVLTTKASGYGPHLLLSDVLIRIEVAANQGINSITINTIIQPDTDWVKLVARLKGSILNYRVIEYSSIYDIVVSW